MREKASGTSEKKKNAQREGFEMAEAVQSASKRGSPGLAGYMLVLKCMKGKTSSCGG